MCLAKNIRFLRRKKEMSQEALASLLGYKSYTTIQKWETGVSEPPIKQLRRMADLFQVDIDDMAKVDLEVVDHETQLSLNGQVVRLSPEEQDLVISFRRSDDLTKQMVLRLLGMEPQDKQDCLLG